MLNKTARMKKNAAFHVHGKLLVLKVWKFHMQNMQEG